MLRVVLFKIYQSVHKAARKVVNYMAEEKILNETLRDAEFKDESPLKTVEHAKSILKNLGIETEEHWFESGVPYCHSLRVSVSGTTFGVNGKGMTHEFAFASGYGELMERLQVGVVRLCKPKDNKDSNLSSIIKYVNYKELLERNRNWYENYANILESIFGVKYSPEDILKQFADENDNVRVTPFFCVNTRTIEYHPIELRNQIYTSNGCAAGNTPEEAIVQGISEIVERRHKIRILTENIAVPEIPDEVLKKHTAAYKIITFLRENGFDVTVKDCSLGTKYPVICLSCIDKATGKYHDHFGAYPIFEIALERALTESFQGRSIDNFTIMEDFLYDRTSTYPIHELAYENVFGVSRKRPGFFIESKGKSWNESCGFNGKNNKELFKECIEFFKEQGYDVLIRDLSCLGFPTYQIIVPGYSETRIYRLSPKHNDMKNSDVSTNVFRNPSASNMSDILATIMYIEENKNFNKSLNHLSFTNMAKLAAKTTPQEETKLYAATLGCIFYTIGKYGDVLRYIQQLIPLCEKTEKEYLICLKRYLSLKLYKYEADQIDAILRQFHKPETVEEIYACIKSNRNPLERFTLHCDSECNENCPLKHCCCDKYTNYVADMIDSKMGEIDIDVSIEKLLKLL